MRIFRSIDRQAIGFESNRVEHVLIRGNTVGGYTDSGVRVWGGFANAGVFPLTVRRNVVEDVTVWANTVTSASKQAIGIAVLGGESRGGAAREKRRAGGLDQRQSLVGQRHRRLVRRRHGHTGAAEYSRRAHFDANVLDANDVRVAATENSSSASGNAVRFPRRPLAGH